MTALLLGALPPVGGLVALVVWHVAGELHADRVERRWRASWPALPPAEGPTWVESERVRQIEARR